MPPGWRAAALLAASLLLPASSPLAVTPGEATDLLVTGYDPATGNLSITFTAACAAADHHIEFGPLADVGIPGYSGQDCGIGTSGAYATFNPGAGSYFFVVVGNDGAGVEGSYGTALIGGAEIERPEDLSDPVCTLTQDLSQRCDGPFLPLLDMVAYRPLSEGYGAPFQRTAVPDADELVPGAGIRVNGDDDDGNSFADRDDVGVAGENDLVEVVLMADPQTPAPGYEYVLERSNPNLRVWDEPTKQTEILGAADSAVLSFASPSRSVWVENPLGGDGDIRLVARSTPGGTIVASDQVHLYAFTSVVIALGGEGQVPADPPLEPDNHGTFQVAILLYGSGYDVHMYDEDVVSSSGAGAAYDEVVRAVRDRGVGSVAIYGYSHGGGSTNDLAIRLDNNRATIGTFSIDFTGYMDGIDNKSNIDTDTETGFPQSAAYLLNYYENPGCTGFLALCGGPVGGADNREVFGVTHFTVDDDPSVLQGMRDELILRVAP